MPTTTSVDASLAGNASSTSHLRNAGSGSHAAKHQRTGLPAAVSHFYYKHGLFLSSYPTCASSIAIVAILFSW